MSTTKTTKNRKFILSLFLLNLLVDDITSVLFSTIDYISICVLIVFVCKSFFRIKTIDKKLFLFLTMSLLAIKIVNKSFSFVENFSQIRFIESFLQTFLFFLSTLLRLLITLTIRNFLLFARMLIFFKMLTSILITAIETMQKLKCFLLKTTLKK